MRKRICEVSHLKQYFPVRKGFHTIPLKAVDDISFAIKPGETLGLVGESGCGKTTVDVYTAPSVSADSRTYRF